MMNRLSLRTRFIGTALITLIPLVLVVVFFLDRSEDRSYQEVVNSESTISSLVNQSLTNYINSHFQTIDRLASLPAVQAQEDTDEVNRVLGEARTLRPDMSGVFLVNPDGDVVGESGTDADSVLPYVQSQISSTVSTGQRLISQRIDLDGETSVIVLLAPVTSISQTTTNVVPTETPDAQTNDDASQPVPTQTATPSGTPGTQPPGAVLGVIGTVIPVDNITQQVIPSLRTRMDVVVLSSDQVITASSDIQENEQEFLQIIDDLNIRTGESGSDVFEMQRSTGTLRVATFSPIQLDAADWGLVVSSPAPGNNGDSLVLEGVLLLALATLAIVSFAIVIGEITARPLRDLSSDGGRLEQGNYNVTTQTHGTGEMLDLSSSLARVADRLRHQASDLEESQQDRQRQTTQMRDLLRRTLRLQEDERRRIAGEIHDAVSPLITGALYQTRAMQMSNGEATHEERSESLESVNTLLERASEELHGVIFDLRPPDLDDIGVVAAIEAYVSTIQRTGLEARLEVDGELPQQTPEVRLGIYRIVQEALHNVLRHASADEAIVRIEYEDELLRVTIRDNGSGFDPDAAMRPTSLGLLSMRERAASIGATFDIISRPGAGTAIVVERPETGSVMSDDIFYDLVHRDHEEQVVDSEQSSENRSDEDATGTQSAETGDRL